MNKQNAAFLSIFSNTALIIFKIVAGLLMGSVSVISEAIHSSIDLLASVIAFFSIKKASKAEDDEHPFGHGKYENVSGFVEAILILIAAILIIFEAVKKLFSNEPVQNIGAGILVMFVASLVNFIISMILLKISKKTDSIALEADAMHLLTDVFTSLGVLFGLVLLKVTGIKIIDPLTALFVALLILKTAITLIKKSLLDLVDSRLPLEELTQIQDIISSHKEISAYHNLRTRKSGSTKEIDVQVHVNKDTTLVQAHTLCDEIEAEIKAKLPGETYVIIHAEPDCETK